MDVKNLIDNFKKQDSTYSKLKEYYNSPSFLEILGVDRKEVVHSQFLAWLFRLGNDENGNTPLYFLIKYLFNKEAKFNNIQSNDIDLISIETEKGSDNRIDITLRLSIGEENYCIIIENKVYAKEHNKQTHRYAKQPIKGFINKFYYLVSAPNKKLSKENFPDIHEAFTIINYQGILDQVICQLKYKDQTIQFVINEYIKSLSKSWRYYIKNRNNNHNVMALNQEHRELLNEFWEENKDLIILSLQAISEDDSFDKNVHKEVEEAVNLLIEHQEKQSKEYVLELENKRSEKFLLVDVVRQVLELTKVDEQLNKKILDYFLDNKDYNTYSLVIPKSNTEYKKNQSRYGKKEKYFYKIKGDRTSYACLRNWGINNIGDFKNMLKTRYSIELKAVN